ncbi:MAG: hypothetical protein ABI306_06590 [Caulobacteraceae bacterium]
MIRLLSIALAAGLVTLVAVPAPRAMAQEAISTAANAPAAGAPAASANAAPIAIPDTIDEDDAGPLLPVGPCGAVGRIHDGKIEKPDKKPHGAVWAGVGTSGYREAGGVVCQPIGDHSAVTIAVDTAHIGGR